MSKQIDINRQGFTQSSTYDVTVDENVDFTLEGISRGTIDFPNGNPFGKSHNSFSLPHDPLLVLASASGNTYRMTLSNLRDVEGNPVGGPLDTLSGNLQVNPKPIEDCGPPPQTKVLAGPFRRAVPP